MLSRSCLLVKTSLYAYAGGAKPTAVVVTHHAAFAHDLSTMIL